jgi:hypothetical protein
LLRVIKDYRLRIPKDVKGNYLSGYSLDQYQFFCIVKLSYLMTQIRADLNGCNYLPIIAQTLANPEIQKRYFSFGILDLRTRRFSRLNSTSSLKESKIMPRKSATKPLKIALKLLLMPRHALNIDWDTTAQSLNVSSPELQERWQRNLTRQPLLGSTFSRASAIGRGDRP